MLEFLQHNGKKKLDDTKEICLFFSSFFLSSERVQSARRDAVEAATVCGSGEVVSGEFGQPAWPRAGPHHLRETFGTERK